MSIISISGKIGSGKDTVAQMIQDIQPKTWEVKKFAGKLKQIVSLLTGIPVEDLEKQEVKDSKLGPEWSFYSNEYFFLATGSRKILTPIEFYKLGPIAKKAYVLYEPTMRWLLQALGTDAMRDVIHKNIHVNALFADYRGRLSDGSEYSWEKLKDGIYISKHPPIYPNWIISDMRFENELEAVKAKGGITLRIHRDTKSVVSTHLKRLLMMLISITRSRIMGR